MVSKKGRGKGKRKPPSNAPDVATNREPAHTVTGATRHTTAAVSTADETLQHGTKANQAAADLQLSARAQAMLTPIKVDVYKGNGFPPSAETMASEAKANQDVRYFLQWDALAVSDDVCFACGGLNAPQGFALWRLCGECALMFDAHLTSKYWHTRDAKFCDAPSQKSDDPNEYHQSLFRILQQSVRLAVGYPSYRDFHDALRTEVGHEIPLNERPVVVTGQAVSSDSADLRSAGYWAMHRCFRRKALPCTISDSATKNMSPSYGIEVHQSTDRNWKATIPSSAESKSPSALHLRFTHVQLLTSDQKSPYVTKWSDDAKLCSGTTKQTFSHTELKRPVRLLSADDSAAAMVTTEDKTDDLYDADGDDANIDDGGDEPVWPGGGFTGDNRSASDGRAGPPPIRKDEMLPTTDSRQPPTKVKAEDQCVFGAHCIGSSGVVWMFGTTRVHEGCVRAFGLDGTEVNSFMNNIPLSAGVRQSLTGDRGVSFLHELTKLTATVYGLPIDSVRAISPAPTGAVVTTTAQAFEKAVLEPTRSVATTGAVSLQRLLPREPSCDERAEDIVYLLQCHEESGPSWRTVADKLVKKKFFTGRLMAGLSEQSLEWLYNKGIQESSSAHNGIALGDADVIRSICKSDVRIKVSIPSSLPVQVDGASSTASTITGTVVAAVPVKPVALTEPVKTFTISKKDIGPSCDLYHHLFKIWLTKRGRFNLDEECKKLHVNGQQFNAVSFSRSHRATGRLWFMKGTKELERVMDGLANRKANFTLQTLNSECKLTLGKADKENDPLLHPTLKNSPKETPFSTDLPLPRVAGTSDLTANSKTKPTSKLKSTPKSKAPSGNAKKATTTVKVQSTKRVTAKRPQQRKKPTMEEDEEEEEVVDDAETELEARDDDDDETNDENDGDDDDDDDQDYDNDEDVDITTDTSQSSDTSQPPVRRPVTRSKGKGKGKRAGVKKQTSVKPQLTQTKRKKGDDDGKEGPPKKKIKK